MPMNGCLGLIAVKFGYITLSLGNRCVQCLSSVVMKSWHNKCKACNIAAFVSMNVWDEYL